MVKRKCVLVGSFHEDPTKLKAVFNKLKKSYQLLSPISINFVDSKVDFVKSKVETKLSIRKIEENHLLAIKKAEFVWVFAPGGYVGKSAAFEIGFAHAIGIPLYTDSAISDVMLKNMVTRIDKLETVPRGVHKPGTGIDALQEYYKRVSDERGWSEESARDTMLLLTEEIGELARAIRKEASLSRDGGYKGVSIMDEIADVQLYLVHLANCLKLNISEAVTQKEIKNHRRHSINKQMK